jgi:hypothetical protein
LISELNESKLRAFGSFIIGKSWSKLNFPAKVGLCRSVRRGERAVPCPGCPNGKEGAKEVLNNIANIKVPEGLSKEAMKAYRELINRVPDTTGTQAVRAEILDFLLK